MSPVAPAAEVVSLPQVTADACIDDSFPRLVGDWVLHCGPEGRVDRGWNLTTRVGVTLARAEVSPASGRADGADAVLWSPETGAWPLDASLADGTVVQPVGDWPHLPPAVGPRALAFTGGTAVVVDGRGVDAFAEGVRARSLTAAAPARGQRVAATRVDGTEGVAVVWVERSATTDLDLWMRTPDGARAPLAVGPGDAWRPVADGGQVVWVEADAVVLLDLAAGVRTRFPARTGFLDDPTLSDGVACWSDRDALAHGGDIDVRCSDGFVLARAGHQLHPSRSGARMIVREGARLLVVTFPARIVASEGEHVR